MNRRNLLLATSVTVMTTVALYLKERNNRSRRKVWTKNWLKRREEGRGVLNLLNSELLSEDLNSYRNYLRLSNNQFEQLLRLVESDIAKSDTSMRESVSARNRLEVTLRFLATGETFRSLMYSTRIHESTISKFIPEVCKAIYKHLSDDYLTTPTTAEAWKKIADDFYKIWQFPNCLGALDGRHIKFRPPRSDGSYYYNYKGDHSIVLLAMVDANYKFTYVNVGVNGRISDGGVFRECKLSEAIKNNDLNFPPSNVLPGRTIKVPYVIVADDAFPLSSRILKPYPQRGLSYERRIFNYRLSRARRVVENAFGILANRFRVLLNPIHLRPEKVEIITLACVTLHNFLADPNSEENSNTILQHVGPQGNNRSTNEAQRIREEFQNYLCSGAGAVDWQDDAILQNNL